MTQDLPEKPKAILMISGHWERKTFGVQSSPAPGMEYDYYGFPAHTYAVKYQAPGAPDVAVRVAELIKSAGFAVDLDDKRLRPRRVCANGRDVPKG